LEGVFQLPASPPDGLDVQAGDLREEAITPVADLHGLEGDVPAALLLIEAAEQEVHPLVEESIGVVTVLKTRGALALVNDRHRHRTGSLHRDTSQRKSVSGLMDNAEQLLDGPEVHDTRPLIDLETGRGSSRRIRTIRTMT
jgi:hypothetical protein